MRGSDVVGYLKTQNLGGDLTLLVLALGNMLPEPLHAGAVRRDGALPVLVGALRGVAKEEEALLLVP